MDPDRETKISVEEAASLLGISTKTIQRYLASGLLTKVKVRHRTWLLKSEVEELGRTRSSRKSGEAARSALQAAATDVVTISRARYESLLIELGELRKECELLAAAESRRRELELALRDAEAELTRTRMLLDQRREPAGNVTEVHENGRPIPPEPPGKARATPTRKPWWQR